MQTGNRKWKLKSQQTRRNQVPPYSGVGHFLINVILKQFARFLSQKTNLLYKTGTRETHKCIHSTKLSAKILTKQLGAPAFFVSAQILMPKLVNLGRFKVCIRVWKNLIYDPILSLLVESCLVVKSASSKLQQFNDFSRMICPSGV